MIDVGQLREANRRLKRDDVALALRDIRNGADAGKRLLALVVELAVKLNRIEAAP
jgi:hypothetical protein